MFGLIHQTLLNLIEEAGGGRFAQQDSSDDGSDDLPTPEGSGVDGSLVMFRTFLQVRQNLSAGPMKAFPSEFINDISEPKICLFSAG